MTLKYLELAMREGIAIKESSPQTGPEARYMVSLNYHHATDLWVRLPRWLSAPWLAWKLRKYAARAKVDFNGDR